MRLKRHLSEAIVLADKKTLKIYSDLFKEIYETIMKYLNDTLDDYDNYDDMIDSGATKLVDLMNKKFGATKTKTGIQFTANPIKGLKDRDAGAGLSGDPQREKQKWGISFNYDPWIAVDLWYASSSKFKQWHRGMVETLEHELIHIGQFKAMKKNIKRWQEFEEVIFKGMQKVYAYDEIKKQLYMKSFDAYVADRQEVMAYASQAAKEIDQPWQETIKDATTTKGHKKFTRMSQVFEMFHEYKDQMPKTWKKFLRYFVDYVKTYKKKN